MSTTRRYHAALYMADSRYALEVEVDQRTGRRIVTISKNGAVVAVLPED